jgi:hypothetical protein
MLCAPAIGSAANDADALIARLAKPAPASIAFTEVRFSRLLRAPLIVSGQLSYNGADSMDRQVEQPYREHTAIRGESVRVEREGEQPRSFALKHAPELRGLLSGFSALLAGDVAAIKRSFSVAMDGDNGSWTLELTPNDARARKRLNQIVVDGSEAEPHCFSMLNADGSKSVLLLGATATNAVAANVTAEDLQKRCQSRTTPAAAP